MYFCALFKRVGFINCCCSSVVEHFLGKEEVVSSSLINSSEKSNNDWSATVRWHLFLMTILDACIQSIAIKNKYRFRRLQSLVDFLSATRQDERSEVKSDQQTQGKTSDSDVKSDQQSPIESTTCGSANTLQTPQTTNATQVLFLIPVLRWGAVSGRCEKTK